MTRYVLRHFEDRMIVDMSLHPYTGIHPVDTEDAAGCREMPAIDWYLRLEAIAPGLARAQSPAELAGGLSQLSERWADHVDSGALSRSDFRTASAARDNTLQLVNILREAE